MDKGEFIKSGYSVEPGDGGSFIVVQGGRNWRDNGFINSTRGFTNWKHLVEWLAGEHKAIATAQAENPIKSSEI